MYIKDFFKYGRIANNPRQLNQLERDVMQRFGDLWTDFQKDNQWAIPLFYVRMPRIVLAFAQLAAFLLTIDFPPSAPFRENILDMFRRGGPPPRVTRSWPVDAIYEVLCWVCDYALPRGWGPEDFYASIAYMLSANHWLYSESNRNVELARALDYPTDCNEFRWVYNLAQWLQLSYSQLFHTRGVLFMGTTHTASRRAVCSAPGQYRVMESVFATPFIFDAHDGVYHIEPTWFLERQPHPANFTRNLPELVTDSARLPWGPAGDRWRSPVTHPYEFAGFESETVVAFDNTLLPPNVNPRTWIPSVPADRTDGLSLRTTELLPLNIRRFPPYFFSNPSYTENQTLNALERAVEPVRIPCSNITLMQGVLCLRTDVSSNEVFLERNGNRTQWGFYETDWTLRVIQVFRRGPLDPGCGRFAGTYYWRRESFVFDETFLSTLRNEAQSQQRPSTTAVAAAGGQPQAAAGGGQPQGRRQSVEAAAAGGQRQGRQQFAAGRRNRFDSDYSDNDQQQPLHQSSHRRCDSVSSEDDRRKSRSSHRRRQSSDSDKHKKVKSSHRRRPSRSSDSDSHKKGKSSHRRRPFSGSDSDNKGKSSHTRRRSSDFIGDGDQKAVAGGQEDKSMRHDQKAAGAGGQEDKSMRNDQKAAGAGGQDDKSMRHDQKAAGAGNDGNVQTDQPTDFMQQRARDSSETQSQSLAETQHTGQTSVPVIYVLQPFPNTGPSPCAQVVPSNTQPIMNPPQQPVIFPAHLIQQYMHQLQQLSAMAGQQNVILPPGYPHVFPQFQHAAQSPSAPSQPAPGPQPITLPPGYPAPSQPGAAPGQQHMTLPPGYPSNIFPFSGLFRQQ